MTELLVLAAFAASLFLCVGLNLSVLIALVFGFFLFFEYGLWKRHSVRQMLQFVWSGIRTVGNILVTFVLIGVITAVWRADGTIAYIVAHATRILSPHSMILVTFLLCCLVSCLTGTAFGAAATMGVICATMAGSMGIPSVYIGGAVLAGSYFGDRCSPMSTSALLVSTLTKTDLFHNIAVMIKTSVVPFLLTCGIYALLGRGFDAQADSSTMRELFSSHFVLHPTVLIPAIVIIVLSLCRINVRITMGVSILCAVVLAIVLQKVSPAALLEMAVMGYHPENAEVAALLSGGGIVSMARVILIVCISSCYSGMFNGTGLLNGVRSSLSALSRKVTPFGCILLTASLSALIACNQTLTIMLTCDLCQDVEHNPVQMASDLEDTAVVLAPLVPWSIAGAVPLATVGAPTLSLLTSFYLYLLPLWRFFMQFPAKRRCGKTA